MAPNPLVAFRLPHDLLFRLDGFAALLNKEHPGLGYGRPEACKVLLARHLPTLEELGLDAPAAPLSPASSPTKPSAKSSPAKPTKATAKTSKRST